MRARLKSRNGILATALAAGALVALGGWFLLVAPQRARVAEVEQSVRAAESGLAQREAQLARPSAKVTVTASDLYRLAKALPDTSNTAGVILDVNGLAKRNELDFVSIEPSEPVLGTGYLREPLAVVVQGRFGNISSFLGDLRSLVRVRNGRLDVRGRMYSITQVDLGPPESSVKFPIVKASVTLNAFRFSAPPPEQAAPDESSSTPSSGGSVAAGVTP